jgi:hypothetical protein
MSNTSPLCGLSIGTSTQLASDHHDDSGPRTSYLGKDTPSQRYRAWFRDILDPSSGQTSTGEEVLVSKLHELRSQRYCDAGMIKVPVQLQMFGLLILT